LPISRPTSLPISVARALADSEVATVDVPWQPARSLARYRPTADELHAALASLIPPPVSEAHAARCFARLMVAFEPGTRANADEAKIRLAVWLEANRDLGDALWSKATLETIRTRTFMPRPAEFRAAVAPDLDRAARTLARCRQMLAALCKAGQTAPEPETLDVRLATIRDTWRKLGKPDRAAKAERELATLEGRAPAAWVNERASTQATTAANARPDRPPYVRPSGPDAERFAVLADCFHRGVAPPAWDEIAVASIDRNPAAAATGFTVAYEPAGESTIGRGADNRLEEWDAEPE
jgi:hypothetical protein